MREIYDVAEMNIFADECVSQLKKTDIEYIKHHISYYAHHFGYGLYLRNTYASKAKDVLNNDSFSRELYFYVIKKLFPESGEDVTKIRAVLDREKYAEVCAHYYAEKGEMPFKEFPIPEDIYGDFFDWCENQQCDRISAEFGECENEDFRRCNCTWWEMNNRKIEEYIFSIAEALWNYNDFYEKAKESGLSDEIIRETYDNAKKLFAEKCIFLPLEILFYSRRKFNDDKVKSKVIRHIICFFKRNNDVKMLPEYLFRNRELVLIAAEYEGCVLKYSPKFRDDFAIVKRAVENSPTVIEFASRRLKKHMKIVETAARNSKYSLIFKVPCMKKYNDDDRIVRYALRANGANISSASRRIGDSYGMAETALKHQCNVYSDLAYESLSARLRADKSLAITAIKNNKFLVRSMSAKLKNDDDIAQFICGLKDSEWLLKYMSKRIQRKYSVQD